MDVAILISNKIDFKLKSIRRYGEGHFIFITGTIHQEEFSILNIYAPVIKAPTYVKETLLELKACIKPHNKIETQKTIQRINETKSWYLEKINKIDKPLSKLIFSVLKVLFWFGFLRQGFSVTMEPVLELHL